MKKLSVRVPKIFKSKVFILLVVLIIAGVIFNSHQQEKKKLNQFITTEVKKKTL